MDYGFALGRYLVYAVLFVGGMVALFFGFGSVLQYLANFTEWAQRWLEGWNRWKTWATLPSRDRTVAEQVSVEPPTPFAAYRNPFDGSSNTSPVEQLRYTFEALQAFAREKGVDPSEVETPLEFSARLETAVPELEGRIRGLAGLYGRAAYANANISAEDREVMKRCWRSLETHANV